MDITVERLEELLAWHKEQRDYHFRRHLDICLSKLNRDISYMASKFHGDSADAIDELIAYRRSDMTRLEDA